MKFILVVTLIISFASGYGGHSHLAMAADTKPVSATLAPMPKPRLLVGTTKKWRSSRGSEYTEKIVGVDESTSSFATTLGCNYKKIPYDFMAQYLEWTNCGRRRSNGRGSIEMVEGKIWPLKVGNTWTYNHEGSTDSGRSWSGQRSCEVTDQVRVSVPAGSFDTYRVDCESEYVKREYYISPVAKMNVLYKWEHKTKLRDFQRELVSYKLVETK